MRATMTRVSEQQGGCVCVAIARGRGDPKLRHGALPALLTLLAKTPFRVVDAIDAANGRVDELTCRARGA